MLSEQQVIILLQQEDKQAIEWMYDRYGAALYGVLFRIVQVPEIAEDLLQDTFIKIWNNGKRYEKHKGSLFTWALNIARNTAIDKLRSKGFKKQQVIQELNFSVYSDKRDPNAFNPNTIGVPGMVQQLDEKYRSVIDLIYFQGFTQKEVHENLNIPLGTVKSRLRIGLKQLRGLFTENKIVPYLVMLDFFIS